MSTPTTDPDEYVRENRETLAKVIKHGNDDFVRALAMAAIVEYGGDPALEKIRQELDQADDLEGSS